MNLDAAAIAAKWRSRIAQSGPAYLAGVQAVTVAPGEKAAAAADRYAAGVQEAVTSGRFAARSRAVTLQSWQASVRDKASRFSSQGQTAEAKYQQAIAPVINYMKTGLAQLPPRGSLSENIARMNNMVQYMAMYRKSA